MDGGEWMDCLRWILAARVRPGRSVGQVIDALEKGETTWREARRELAAVGLGLLRPCQRAPLAAGFVLMVPNSLPRTERLFLGSCWVGGIWQFALRQAPAWVIITDKKMNRACIAGVHCRCTLIRVAQAKLMRVET